MGTSSHPRPKLRGYTVKGYTTAQAYELGYALAHRAELLSSAANERGQGVAVAVLRATESMRLAVEAELIGGDAANYPLAASFASGSIAGYEAASAEKLARA